MKILITGCAGFIGFHLVKEILNQKNITVIGIDNINDYYDVDLKKNRLKILIKNKRFNFHKLDICSFEKLLQLFKKYRFDYVVNLAAQAGVRYSIYNPDIYFNSNIKGFYNILEVSRINKIKHLIFASTSSVYGNNTSFPLVEDGNTDMPLSFYAATKKSNEAMAYSYSNIHQLPCTGLRFFTVYGPFGRPDMALFKFIDSMYNKKKIDLYNNGNHIRDFTYVDDVVNSIVKLIKFKPIKKIPYDIYNIGCSNPQSLKKFLSIIEKKIGKKAKIKYLPLQKGDIYKTHASVKKLENKIKYKPRVDIETGIGKFIDWYKSYYKLL